MPEQLSAQQVVSKADDLKKQWTTRHNKFIEWWDILTMKDTLQKSSMESFVGNDPRTAFNLALHLLTPSKVLHRIPTDDLLPIDIQVTSTLEALVTKEWKQVDVDMVYRGRGRWIDRLVKLLLLTGWISVYTILGPKRSLVREVWHPDQTYPKFGEDGMTECAHIYKISASEANRRIKNNPQFKKPLNPYTADVTVSDYWAIDADGVFNGLCYNNDAVVPWMKDPQLDVIPILCFPVGGLPDEGQLTSGSEWTSVAGQSLFATNENVYKNYNRQRTFLQQMMRDTAQPRWLEKSRGGPIMKPDEVFMRGAIFRCGIDESVQPLPVPAIPVELSTSIFDVQNQIQRGTFPYAMQGNIQQQMSGYMVSQISAQGQQVLHPYYEAIVFTLSHIDNVWLDSLRKGRITAKLPDGTPFDKTQIRDVFRFDSRFHLNIPGDFMQRSSVGKMLNPMFEMSTSTIMDTLFPEIEDPLQEMAKARSQKALEDPIAKMLMLIGSLEEQAALLKAEGNNVAAQRFASAAKAIQQKLGQLGATPEQPEMTGGEGGAPTMPGPRQEVMPRESMETMIPPEMGGEMGG